jgi:hypothetical protein
LWLQAVGLVVGGDFGLPERFGLKNEAVPEGIFRQLAYPFRRAKPLLPAKLP